MKRTILLLITLLSLLFTACGPAASGSQDHNSTTAASVSDESSDSSDAFISDADVLEIDEGLHVVLTEIRELVHPGESGSSLKSAQAAADVLDFALGTELTGEAVGGMTQIYCESLSESDAAEFAEQLQLLDETITTLQSAGGKALLEDAGVTDSSYPWTDDAFARAGAIVQAGATVQAGAK